MFAYNSLPSDIRPRSARGRAAAAFESAYLRGWLDRLWATLTGHARRLRTLNGSSGEQHFSGAQVVPIHQIQGTEERAEDFDADFHPLRLDSRDRWVSVFVAWQNGTALPPVELTRVGDVYYVRDGHHRISVARALGMDYVDAIVTERWLNLPR